MSAPEAAPESSAAGRPSFGRSMSVMWVYTLLRFGLFFVLWGLLALFNVRGYVGAGIALILSIPLSWVLLSRPRQAFAANLEQRVQYRVQQKSVLDAQLGGAGDGILDDGDAVDHDNAGELDDGELDDAGEIDNAGRGDDSAVRPGPNRSGGRPKRRGDG